MQTCLICGVSVTVTGTPEIVTCEKDNCIHTVETSIGLHYQAGQIENNCLSCLYCEQRPKGENICWHSSQSKIFVDRSFTCRLFTDPKSVN